MRRPQAPRISYVSGGSGQVVTTAELKKHLRITHSNDDSYINALIEAATDEIDMPRADHKPEGWLGRALLSRKLRLSYNDVPPLVIRLPGGRVTAIDKVEYRDRDDNFQTIDSGDYHSDLTQEPALLWADEDWPIWPHKEWPEDLKGGPDTFRVEFTCGYATASDVPAQIKQWIMMRAAEMYRDREGTIRGSIAKRMEHFNRMLDQYRVRV